MRGLGAGYRLGDGKRAARLRRRLWAAPNPGWVRGRRPRARASAFQADDTGSIPVDRSTVPFLAVPIGRGARLLISSFEVRILG